MSDRQDYVRLFRSIAVQRAGPQPVGPFSSLVTGRDLFKPICDAVDKGFLHTLPRLTTYVKRFQAGEFESFEITNPKFWFKMTPHFLEEDEPQRFYELGPYAEPDVRVHWLLADVLEREEAAENGNVGAENGLTADDQHSDSPTLTKEQIAILDFLTERHPALCNNYDIESGAQVSRATAGKAVKKLMKMGYVERPVGTSRKGVTATKAGRDVAALVRR